MGGDDSVLFLGKEYKEGDHIASYNLLLNVLFIWRQSLFSFYIFFMKNKVKLCPSVSWNKLKHSWTFETWTITKDHTFF